MKKGILKVYLGPMYSSKSSRMIDDIQESLNKKILVFKPSVDTRTNNIYSRDEKEYPAIVIEDILDIKKIVDLEKDIEHIFIDEYQFFKLDIIKLIREIISKGINVTISGLDTDFKKDKFGPTLKTAKFADEVIKLKAKCYFCGRPAPWTVRLFNGKPAPLDAPIILPESFGNTKIIYQSVCNKHHPRKDK